MFIFWFWIALFLMIALIVLFFPFVKTFRISHAQINSETPFSREKTNVQIYQQNLEQLKTDWAQKKITQKQFEENQFELQKNLLEDIPEPLCYSKSAQISLTQFKLKTNWKTISFLLIAFPLFSIIFYLYNGNSQGLSHFYIVQNETQSIAQMRETLGTPQQVISTLKQHLAQDPQSAKGWYLLGRLYFTQQEYSKSVNAFAKAYQLDSKKPEILFQYAQALYLTKHSLKGEPTILLEQLLALQPHNPLAINLLAVSAYNDHHYQKAITYWEKLLPYYSPESTDGKALMGAIARANKRL